MPSNLPSKRLAASPPSSEQAPDSKRKGLVVELVHHLALTEPNRDGAPFPFAQIGVGEPLTDALQTGTVTLVASNTLTTILCIADLKTRILALMDFFSSLRDGSRHYVPALHAIIDTTRTSERDDIKQYVVTDMFRSTCVYHENTLYACTLPDAPREHLLEIAFTISHPVKRLSCVLPYIGLFDITDVICDSIEHSFSEIRGRTSLSAALQLVSEQTAGSIPPRIWALIDNFKQKAGGPPKTLTGRRTKIGSEFNTGADHFDASPKRRGQIQLPRLSAKSILFLRERAITHNWQNRQEMGYHRNTSPLDFISREYRTWLKKGLTRSELRTIDKGLSRRLDIWVQEGNTIPTGLFARDTDEAEAMRAYERERKQAYRMRNKPNISVA